MSMYLNFVKVKINTFVQTDAMYCYIRCVYCTDVHCVVRIVPYLSKHSPRLHAIQVIDNKPFSSSLVIKFSKRSKTWFNNWIIIIFSIS